MSTELLILRSQVDGLGAEVLELKAEVAEMKAEIAELKAGLKSRIEAGALRVQAAVPKAEEGQDQEA